MNKEQKEIILEPLKKDMMDKVKRWNILGMDNDDKFQEVYLQCWIALDKYNGTSSYRTYLWRVMDNKLKNMYRNETKQTLDNLCSNNVVPNFYDKTIDVSIFKNKIIKEIKKLPIIEREIMEVRYGLNSGIEHTQEEVSIILGINQSRISRTENKIISKIKSIEELKDYFKK
jgi:RNA polymerase sigma factor (sigma-70 family)